MFRLYAATSAAVLGLLAGPAFAGLVYVPLVDAEIDGIHYETQVWVSNRGDEARRVSTFFIPTGTDGLERGDLQPEELAIASGATVLVKSLTAPGTTGLLEFNGAPQVAVGARLVAIVDGAEQLGSYVPVLSSDNVIPAGDLGHLHDWVRNANEATDFGVFNLGHEATQCNIRLFRANGQPLIGAAVISLPPLSQRWFGDVLALIGQTSISAVRSETSCDQPFYVYANTYDRTSGQVAFRGPSGLLTSSLTDPSGPPPPECDPGAVCFEENGVFFTPTRSNQVGEVVFPVPPGQYRQVHLTMDVTHGGWWPSDPNGRHNILWLVRNGNRDLFGYINVSGPDKNELLIRHGFGQRHVDKPKITAPLVLNPGQTYRFDYLYDTAQRLLVLTILDSSGREVRRVTGAPDISVVDIDPGDRVFIRFGFEEGHHPDEHPTYGWAYRNLRVNFLPR